MNSRCPICWLPVIADVYTCAGCRTLQHAACVATGGCVVAGCKGGGALPVASSDAVQQDADAAAEARAAKLAQLAEGARAAREARLARQAQATSATRDNQASAELGGAPWTATAEIAADLGAHAPIWAQRAPAREPGLVAAPATGAAADPSRGWFGRLLDAAAEAIAVLPRALPLLALLSLLSMVPTLPFFFGSAVFGFGPFFFALSFACGLLVPALMVPSFTLLLAEPETRRASLGALLWRAVGTWPRLIPTGIGAALVFLLPVWAAMYFFADHLGRSSWAGMIAAGVVTVLYGGFVQALFFTAPVTACLPRDREPRNPLARSVSLACAHPLSAFGAVIAAVVVPALAAFVLQMLLMKFHDARIPMLVYWLLTSVIQEVVTRLWPIAYLVLLHRDLTASEK